MTDKIKPGSKIRHIKRGGTYAVLGEANVQTGEPLGDYARVIVYMAHHDGRLWVRPLQEFSDRFEITNETDSREEIVARALSRMLRIRYSTPWSDDAADLDAWRTEARGILAALDAARPLTPETAPTMADMQRMTDDLLTDPAAMDAYMKANPLPAESPVDEEVDDTVRRLYMLVDEERIDRSIPLLIERQQAEIARLTKERDAAVRLYNAKAEAAHAEMDRATAAEAEVADLRARLSTVESAAKDTITSLVAAVSLLERVGRVAAPSDKMFGVMLNDYKRSIERARTALYTIKEDRT